MQLVRSYPLDPFSAAAFLCSLLPYVLPLRLQDLQQMLLSTGYSPDASAAPCIEHRTPPSYDLFQFASASLILLQDGFLSRARSCHLPCHSCRSRLSFPRSFIRRLYLPLCILAIMYPPLSVSCTPAPLLSPSPFLLFSTILSP